MRSCWWLVVLAACNPSTDSTSQNVTPAGGFVATGPNLVGDGTTSFPLDLATAISVGNINIASANLTFGVGPLTLPAAPTVVENWNPWGTGPRTTLVRIITAQKGSILGSLVGGKVGDIVILENHGDGSGSYGAGDLKVLFKRTNDTSVPVQNHIYQPNLTDTIIPYTGAMILYYDAANVGWIPIATSTGDKFERLTFNEVSVSHPLTPAPLPPGNTANYDPPGGQFNGGQRTSSWLRLNGDISGTSTLSGIVPYYQPGPQDIASQGPVKIIENIGGPITLLSEDPSSTSINRFAFPNGSIVIPPNGMQMVVYDLLGGGSVNAGRWRPLASPGIFSKISLYQAVTDLALGAQNDNYCPAGIESRTRMRLQPSGPIAVITGLCAQEDGAVRTITAFGTPITLKHQTTSISENRFYLPGKVDATISAGGTATLVYDGRFRAWFMIAKT